MFVSLCFFLMNRAMAAVEMVEKAIQSLPPADSQHSDAGSLNLTPLPGILRLRPMRRQANWT